MNNNNKNISFSLLAETIRHARYSMLKTVNAALVDIYWKVGAFVSAQLQHNNLGEKTVQQLSGFLLSGDPTLKGFDKRSIYRMVQFYESYANTPIVSSVRALLQIADNQHDIIVSPLRTQFKKKDMQLVEALYKQFNNTNILHTVLAEVSWTNHRTIFSRCKLPEEREFYIRICIRENYSLRELDRQISSSLFERVMIGNVKLPEKIKESYPGLMGHFKDSYIFEFLNLPEPHNENELKKGLLLQMKQFILELGKDFLFAGQEYKVQVGARDFFIDLLFYHRGLQCLVAIELKTDRFEPEYLGKLNLYLEALDRDVKKQNENPSIGILLCKDRDEELVEYALNRSLSPTLIAEYNTWLPDKKILQQKLHELFENTIENNNEKA